MAAVAAAAVATAMAAQVSVTLPGSPVPFTLQPVAVLLAGVVLGARLGAASQVLYLVLGIAGASAFAWSPVLLPGVARLVGPTGGFLMAFPMAAAMTGGFADRGWMARPVRAAVALLCGLATLYAGGSAWMMLTLKAPAAQIASGLAPFLVLDLVKAAAVAAAAPSLRRAFERS